ncbi:MAG: hypothetical protein IT557_00325 [Alphaproteobacteria bacterium]|nr:hypothetical protein [Alphaproteobacteria bacterium]
MVGSSLLRHLRLLLLLPLCLAGLGLAGCVVLPLPQDNGEITEGREIAAERSATLELGRTTRAEVTEKLGEPQAIWEERRLFVYAWDRVHWKLLVILAARTGAAGGIFDLPTHYMLLVQFDANDRLSRAERCERLGLTRFGTFLREWADGKRCG